MVLGGTEFLRTVRQYVAGDEQEQRRAKRLAMERTALERVIACVEAVKGEKWQEFRNRHTDTGRDLILYLGRQVCAMKLKEPAKAIGLKDYSPVAMRERRYAARLTLSPKDQKELHRAIQLLNVKM